MCTPVNAEPTLLGRLAVMHQGALGDFLLALPVLEALHRSQPLLRIALCSKAEHVALLAERPYLESVPPAEAELALFFHDDLWRTARVPQFLQDAQAIMIFGQAGSQVLAERFSARLSRPVHWLRSFPPQGHRQHVTQFLLEQCRRFGWSLEEILPELRPAPADAASVQKSLIQGDGAARDRPILIHPGSGGLAKVWPLDNWRTLIHFLRETYPSYPVVLTLGPADERLGGFAREAEALGALTVESPSLPLLAAWLSQGRLYLGSDSGVSHLAALVGTPSIVVFGPSDPDVWAPRGPRVHIVRQSWDQSEVLGQSPAAEGLLAAPVITLAKSLLSRSKDHPSWSEGSEPSDRIVRERFREWRRRPGCLLP